MIELLIRFMIENKKGANDEKESVSVWSEPIPDTGS